MSSDIRKQIVASLKSIEPSEVILFGSYAYGVPDDESDIDLVVVLDTDGFLSFSDRISKKIEILKALDTLDKPVDLLLYTKSEWADLIDKNSSFIRDINQKGVVLEAA